MDLWNDVFAPYIFLSLLDFLSFFYYFEFFLKKYLYSNLKIKSDAF